MNTSALRDDQLVSNTSPLRYFALARSLDLLIEIAGGTLLVPREVLDPDEDPAGLATTLSELGQSERYWEKRSRDPEAMDNWNRLRQIRHHVRQGIQVVDLTSAEIATVAHLRGKAVKDQYGLAAPLGSGEAAVLAIVEHRGGTAVLDEDAARRILADRIQGARCRTSRDLLNEAVARRLITTDQADITYQDMLAKGYRGPAHLQN